MLLLADDNRLESHGAVLSPRTVQVSQHFGTFKSFQFCVQAPRRRLQDPQRFERTKPDNKACFTPITISNHPSEMTPATSRALSASDPARQCSINGTCRLTGLPRREARLCNSATKFPTESRSTSLLNLKHDFAVWRVAYCQSLVNGVHPKIGSSIAP